MIKFIDRDINIFFKKNNSIHYYFHYAAKKSLKIKELVIENYHCQL